MIFTPPDLADLVKREDFKAELSRAASISHQVKGEAYFKAYLTSGGEVKVNQATVGIRELHILNRGIPRKQLTEAHYNWVSPDSSNPEGSHEKNKGGHIEPYSVDLVTIHFHPPGKPIPSPDDFGALNAMRRQNYRIAELCNSNDDSCIQYVNPLELIGCTFGNPESYGLFAAMERANAPINYDDFLGRAAESLSKKSGKAYEAVEFHFISWRNEFKDIEEFIDFINRIGLHSSASFQVHGSDFSDLERAKMFQKKFVRAEK